MDHNNHTDDNQCCYSEYKWMMTKTIFYYCIISRDRVMASQFQGGMGCFMSKSYWTLLSVLLYTFFSSTLTNNILIITSSNSPIFLIQIINSMTPRPPPTFSIHQQIKKLKTSSVGQVLCMIESRRPCFIWHSYIK